MEGQGFLANVGEAAHICAASEGGPRYRGSMTLRDRNGKILKQSEGKSGISNLKWQETLIFREAGVGSIRFRKRR